MDEKNGIMVALLPISAEWTDVDLPHLTLVFCGKVEDRKPGEFNELAKDTASIAMLSSGFLSLETKGINTFGPPEELVDAISIRPNTKLIAMRRFLEKWNKSEYPDFKPHVTIGKHPMMTKPIPRRILFDKISVHWGGESISFWLRP